MRARNVQLLCYAHAHAQQRENIAALLRALLLDAAAAPAFLTHNAWMNETNS